MIWILNWSLIFNSVQFSCECHILINDIFSVFQPKSNYKWTVMFVNCLLPIVQKKCMCMSERKLFKNMYYIHKAPCHFQSPDPFCYTRVTSPWLCEVLMKFCVLVQRLCHGDASESYLRMRMTFSRLRKSGCHCYSTNSTVHYILQLQRQ